MSEYVVSYANPWNHPKDEFEPRHWCWWQQPEPVRAEFRAWYRQHLDDWRELIDDFLRELREKYEGREI